MQINNLTITNFKSFCGKHEFAFDAPAGLHFVTGENQAEPNLGANGAGKSTLFDAVYYALFGKTVRGLKADAVVPWGLRDLAVALTFTTQGKVVKVERRRKGGTNTLLVDGLEADQDALDRLIGLPENLFAAALIRGQFSTMFFDLMPAAQLAMMDDILELDIWTKASARAKESAATTKSGIEKITNDIARNEGAVETHLETLRQAEQRFAAFDKERADEIKVAHDEVDRKKAQLAEIDKKHTVALDEFNAKDDTADRRRTLMESQDWLDCARNDKAGFLAGIRDITARETQWTKRIKHFGALGSTCPTCEQDVGAEHKDACTKVARNEVDKLISEREVLEKELATASSREAKCAEIVKEVTEANDRAKVALDGLAQNIKGIEMERAQVFNEHERANAVLTERQKQENPHREEIARAKNELQACGEFRKTARAQLADAEREHERNVYWVDGFKHIRLFVIDRAITALELEVNSNLVALGLSDYVIRFATEKETKAGGVTRRFDVVVANAATPDKTTPLAAWSGGEYQRLRLACELGLANMILGSRGIVPKFEIFDEPTSHLSTEGVENLMSCLKERARNLDRQVWVIDHTAHAFPFDSVTTIVKDADGSRIAA